MMTKIKGMFEKLGRTERFLFFLLLALFLIAVVAFLLPLIMFGTKVPVRNYDSNFIIQLINSDFGDFFDVLNFVKNRDPYTDAPLYGDIANYPPFGYAVFWLFSLIPGMAGQEMSIESPLGLVSMLLYLLVFTVPVGITLYRRLSKFHRLTRILLLCAVFTSYPFYFCIGRMNMNLMSVFFAFYFIVWYNDKNKIKRQLSLVSLSIAGMTKVYPLFLGVILLRDHRWRDVFLTVLYCVLLFFLPFFLFHGGLSNIREMLSYMAEFSGEAIGFNKNDISFNKLLRSVILLLGFGSGNAIPVVTSVLADLLFLFSCAALVFTKNNFRFTMLATLAYLNLPNVNYTYSLVFLIVPFYIYLQEEVFTEGEKNKENKVLITISAISVSYLTCVFMLSVSLLVLGIVLIIKKYCQKPIMIIVLSIGAVGTILLLYLVFSSLFTVGYVNNAKYGYQIGLGSTVFCMQLLLLVLAGIEMKNRISLKRKHSTEETEYADKRICGNDKDQCSEDDGQIRSLAYSKYFIGNRYCGNTLQRCAAV